MKAKQFIIGNLIFIKNPVGAYVNTPIEVVEISSYLNQKVQVMTPQCISFHCSKTGMSGWDMETDYFEPIPLTEEWLLKFGFKCVHIKNIHYTVNDPNGVAELHKISIFPTVNNQWHIAFSDELNGYKDYIPTTKISHVHQLQNLYFALTGEELTIKK